MVKVGRPKKYTKEYVIELAKNLVEWIQIPSNFWLGCFAVEYKMDRYRLSRLAEEFPEEFSQAYFLAKQVQENKLVLGALAKKLDGHMAWNALMNVSGWRNKTDIEGGGNTSIVINIINAKIESKDSLDSSGIVHGYRAQIPANS